MENILFNLMAGGFVVLVMAVLLLAVWKFLASRYIVTRPVLAAFYRELAILLDVGHPLLSAFQSAAERQNHPRMKQILTEIAGQIERGNTVSVAMQKFPRVFDQMMIHMVRVGESGAVLEQSMRRLADYMEKAIQMRRKLIAAMVYPMVAGVVLITVLVTLLLWVFPALLAPLEEHQVPLPLPTLIVKGIGDFLMHDWPWLIWIVVLLGVVYYVLKRTPRGQRLMDYLYLKAPLFGPTIGSKVAAARTTETFATLVNAGIPLVPALRVVADTSENSLIKESFQKTADRVEGGGNLTESLKASGIYPDLMIYMLSVGVQAGNLPEILAKTSSTYQEEVDNALGLFTRLQESMMVVLLGAVVLFVAIAAYVPYIKLTEMLQG